MPVISHKRLLEVLEYSPISGVFTWKISLSTRAKVGGMAGRIWQGQYRRITIDRVDYQAHRLAWFYVNGSWPQHEIDHINRAKDDNRISNLRDVNRSGNQQNKGTYANNKSGQPGVHMHTRSGLWRAVISVRGKKKYLGSFTSIDQACAAYQEEKKKSHIETIEHSPT